MGVTIAMEIMEEEVITIQALIGTETTNLNLHIMDLKIIFQDQGHTTTEDHIGTEIIYHHITTDLMNMLQEDHTITDGIDTLEEVMAYTTAITIHHGVEVAMTDTGETLEYVIITIHGVEIVLLM